MALGEGKIFSAQVDARLKAIDQSTGEVIWDAMSEDWEKGFSITGAPIYYDGLVESERLLGRVKDFLFNVFGDEGPVAGRIGNHLHMRDPCL